jgi:cell division protein FtsI (penicillin-binding protein 3)
MVAICIAIIGKAFYIQQIQGNYWKGLSDSLHQRIISIPAERGTIYSEDGQMLSTNMPRFDILIDFRVAPLHEKNGKLFREKIDTICDSLAYLFKDRTPSQYKEELTKAFEAREANHELIKKIDYHQYLKISKFPLFKLGRYKSGLIAIEKNTRLHSSTLSMMAASTPKKVFVLGGDGFCGWPTALHLADKGNTIIIIIINVLNLISYDE